MKKLILILLTLLLFIAPVTVFAEEIEETVDEEVTDVAFIPEGYNYYIAHKWGYNNYYYIGYYKEIPIIDGEYTDGSSYVSYKLNGSCNYYKFESLNDLQAFLYTGSTKLAVSSSVTNTFMRVDKENTNFIYSNFDIKFSTGETYYTINTFTSKDSYFDVDEVDSMPDYEYEDGKVSEGHWYSPIINFLYSIGQGLRGGFNHLGTMIKNLWSGLSKTLKTIVDTIVSIPRKIVSGFEELLKFLFIPDEDVFGNLKDKIYEKLPFFGQIHDFMVNLEDYYEDGEPVFTFTYKGQEMQLVDFAPFAPYLYIIRQIMIALLYFHLVTWFIKYVPGLVKGVQ